MILVAGDFKNSGVSIAWNELRAGQTALASIEQGIRAVEANEADPSVGLGGFPNALGIVELDAGVMEGRTRSSGAVGALQGYLHPVSVAYAVMMRLPHVLLVGEGAARFAESIQAERAELLTETMRKNAAVWREKHQLDGNNGDDRLTAAIWKSMNPQHKADTTVYLAQDKNGDIAVATSTSGWAWKYPGRLGDSPVAGAGFYADNRYGAAACTGRGELSIRAGVARMTVALMQMGRTVQEAVSEVLRDVIEMNTTNQGELQLYAIDPRGNYDVAYIGGDPVADWHFAYVATGDDAEPRRIDSHRIER